MGGGWYSHNIEGVIMSDITANASLCHTQDSNYTYECHKIEKLDGEAYYHGYYYDKNMGLLHDVPHSE